MAETAYTLNITVRNKIATTIDPATVVNGNNDYTVVFDFDSEWDSLSSKTAMFVYGREEQKYKTVTFTGNSCVMPALYNTGYVLIGVFAGDIKTTTAAYVKCIPCIRDNDSTPDTGGGGTIDTGTNDHSQLINRDIADQHPISAITGLEEALTPLVGTTQTITPSQVLAAIKAGRDIALQYTDSHYGTFVFSAFNASEQVGIVVSNSIIPNLDGLTGTLLGSVEDGLWFFNATNTATKDDVGTAVNEALAAAKASGEFDGADGLTPTIGENGNWYLGDMDTGKPSRGDKGDKGETGATGATGAAGAAGKSAYAYAQDGGYAGTEAEFAAKLAKEKFANPNALTFTGAVEGSYDGSAPVSVEIPGGGGSGFDKWECINTFTIPADTAEDVTSIIFSEDAEGKPFALKKFYAVFAGITGAGTYFCIRINNLPVTQQFGTDTISRNNIGERNPLILYFEIAGSGFYHWSCPNVKSFGYRADGDGTPNGGTQSNISQVNKIHFIWGTGSAITPGTTVKLWGVRT